MSKKPFQVGDRVSAEVSGALGLQKCIATIVDIWSDGRLQVVTEDVAKSYYIVTPRQLRHLKPKVPRLEGWANIYRHGFVSYATKEEADEMWTGDVIRCVHMGEVRKKGAK